MFENSKKSNLSKQIEATYKKNTDPVLGLQDDILPEYRRESVVGKGSFGVAILYRRTDDEKLVVLKQINLTELTQSEKDLAMNEVEVFSKLHHPNIISYLGSFIRRDTLIIEMEYANGGTLAQKISEHSPDNFLHEAEILNLFEQITSAITYMHSENILHRDMKTANVFLNNKGRVKIGDFGISKIMSSRIHAQTVLGTPYYFSPEMCEGKEYDEKSDIWALGCILGEICCLKKAFAASNLSELVAKIMTAQYTPLPDVYSADLKHLIRILIQVDPSLRPSANELLQYWLPLLYRNRTRRPFSFAETFTNNNNNNNSQTNQTEQVVTKNQSPEYHVSVDRETIKIEDEPLVERSVLYQLKCLGHNVSVFPLQLPPLMKIVEVATSGSHFITVSDEGFVHTWGEGSKGQLGNSMITSWKHFPTKVDPLKKYNIIGACAGEGFSIFLSDTGLVLSCGDSVKGCLGHGNLSTYLTPKLIEDFKGIDIVQVVCGPEHVLARSKEGAIFSWGSNVNGALGLGTDDHYLPSPNLVEISYSLTLDVKSLYCGPDSSIILLENGDVYGCGSNEDNKLGFGKKLKKCKKFKKIEILSRKVIDLSLSQNHSAFLIEGGYVVTLGNNQYGQRGLGHCKPVYVPTLVTGIKERYIKKVQCYLTYTIVMSDDNIISLWGTRYGIPDGSTTESNSSFLNRPSNDQLDNNNTVNFTKFLAAVSKEEVVLDPIDLLALYSSNGQLAKGRYIQLENIYPLYHSVLFLVSTTAPLASRK